MTKPDGKVEQLLAKHPSLTKQEALKIVAEKNERKRKKREGKTEKIESVRRAYEARRPEPKDAPIETSRKAFMSEQANNPLHGVTLEQLLTRLLEQYGWEGLAQRIDINCFKSDPSIKSSLKFLRKTEWARKKVERLYISTL